MFSIDNGGSNFGKLVLHCMEVSDSESRRIFQNFSRSTTFALFCTAQKFLIQNVFFKYSMILLLRFCRFLQKKLNIDCFSSSLNRFPQYFEKLQILWLKNDSNIWKKWNSAARLAASSQPKQAHFLHFSEIFGWTIVICRLHVDCLVC